MRTDRQISMLPNKIKIFLLVIGFAFSFLTGCENKEDPDPVIASPPIIIVSASLHQSYGTSATFSWIAKGAITSITLDGNAVQAVGSFTTPKLFGDTEYVLLASGPGGSTTQKVQIAVYVPTRTDTLCERSLSLVEQVVLDRNNNIIAKVNLTDYQKKVKYYYYKDGSGLGYDENGLLVSTYNWKWGGLNIILIDGRSFTYYLTGEYMYWFEKSNDGSEILRKKLNFNN